MGFTSIVACDWGVATGANAGVQDAIISTRVVAEIILPIRVFMRFISFFRPYYYTFFPICRNGIEKTSREASLKYHALEVFSIFQRIAGNNRKKDTIITYILSPV
jgi:hypothetical protein